MNKNKNSLINDTLILFANQSDDFFIDKLKEIRSDKVIINYTYKKVSKFLRLFRRIHMKMFAYNQDIWYEEWKTIKEIKTIILFDSILSINIIDFLKKKYPEARIIFWFWNPIKDESIILNLKSKEIEIWSFDLNDCKKYNLKINTQFYFETYLDSPSLKFQKEKIYFIGSDKGRIIKIKKFLEEIKKIGKNIDLKIQVLKDNKTKNCVALDVEVLALPIPYSKIIQDIEESTILLEICQDNQTGLTLRALEALMFNKKLITNNKNIINYDFYKKENIFIIGEKRELNHFLEAEYSAISYEIKENYLFKTWLENFFR
ncbi:MAG: hypothetical protein ACRC3I_04195 [Cetobacterium sp.]